MYYAPVSDFHVTIYEHLNFSRAFVVQFQRSRYIMRLNRTSVRKVTTIWISQELPIFNLERLESNFRVKSYDPWNFSRGADVQFRGSGYIMRVNRTFVWQVMTIWIFRHHTLFNFERLDVLCAWIGFPCDKLWPYEFLESFRCLILSV